jgi:hypothetical protein
LAGGAGGGEDEDGCGHWGLRRTLLGFALLL